MTDNLNDTKNLTSFADHLDEQYGKRGTEEREAYEQEFKAFELEAEKSEQNILGIKPNIERV